ncbi:MAG: response regulator transcription factor [Acetatifactor sp.]|nr:response regulator transcription factor [Acetatifactor sp.]
MQQIMIIEDDPAIRDELTLLLENEGYHPLPIVDFTDIVGQAVENRPDLILLDIGLPKQDGFSLCAGLRKSVNVPIIFVTSRDSSLDEIRALSLGGDDYITKPYNIPVLLARIKAALRRNGRNSETEIIETNGMRLSLAKGTISYGTKTILLTRNELQIMACLMSRPCEIISRTELIETLWDNQIYIDDNTLSVNVTRLRSKLEELGLREIIKTRRGMGYQL